MGDNPQGTRGSGTGHPTAPPKPCQRLPLPLYPAHLGHPVSWGNGMLALPWGRSGQTMAPRQPPPHGAHPHPPGLAAPGIKCT